MPPRPPMRNRCPDPNRRWPRALATLALLLATAGSPCHAQSASGENLAASYRFLTMDRAQGGMLYTATAGTLAGRQLPLSFVDSPAYWGEHVCGDTDCTVEDLYDPATFTLRPRPSTAGDLQTERVNTHNGANIYDAATWQIAVMLGAKRNHLPLPAGTDSYALIANQNLLLRAGHSGDSRHPHPGELRAITQGQVFVYNGQVITKPQQAYSFRMVPRTWLAEDPLAGTTYGRLIQAVNLPLTAPEYQAGRISWTDWKPITGENAWGFFIGPLQAAALHYLEDPASDFVPLADPALDNALAVLPTFAAMQSPLGAVYYAPAGTVANQGTALVNPASVAVENTISLVAGLRILQTTLARTLERDPHLAQAERQRIEQAQRLIWAMLEGGHLDSARQTQGLYSFLKQHAWQNGGFVQGGLADAPGAARSWEVGTGPKAVDVNTWGIAALGPATIDQWFGVGASYRCWQEVKRWGGYGLQTTLMGVGFSDQDGNGIDAGGLYRQGILSAEWTAGAVTMVRSMIHHYQHLKNPPASPQGPTRPQIAEMLAQLQSDETSMLAALEQLRIDRYPKASFPGTPKEYQALFSLATKPYLYASKRYRIPFGWDANPLPSTCATAWMIMVANRYNPFVLGGGSD